MENAAAMNGDERAWDQADRIDVPDERRLRTEEFQRQQADWTAVGVHEIGERNPCHDGTFDEGGGLTCSRPECRVQNLPEGVVRCTCCVNEVPRSEKQGDAETKDVFVVSVRSKTNTGGES